MKKILCCILAKFLVDVISDGGKPGDLALLKGYLESFDELYDNLSQEQQVGGLSLLDRNVQWMTKSANGNGATEDLAYFVRKWSEFFDEVIP